MQRTALICTHGFSDVLTLGRQNRADPYALHVGESPWVAALPDAWRVAVPGRINADGQEAAPLDLPALFAGLTALPHTPTHVAVCLLHAARNPAHELQVRDRPAGRVARRAGDLFARTCPTVANTPASLNAPWQHCWRQGWRCLRNLRQRQQPRPPRAWPGSWNPLADAMQACLVAQAVSSVVREAMDCAAAIFSCPTGACWRRPARCRCCWAACRPPWPGCWRPSPCAKHAAWRRLPEQRPLGRGYPPA
jgi:N-methylhydantoinase B